MRGARGVWWRARLIEGEPDLLLNQVIPPYGGLRSFIDRRNSLMLNIVFWPKV
jgi:hypothetical protein